MQLGPQVSSTQGVLEKFVHSPQSAIMLLHDDPNADVIKVTITDAQAGVRIRDMKLPDDIQVRTPLHLEAPPRTLRAKCSRCAVASQVLTVQRGATTIMPHGFTKLHKTDEMMICGRPNSLASVTAMKKGKLVLSFL